MALSKLGIDFELLVYDHDVGGSKTSLQAADTLREPPHLALKIVTDRAYA
jgi:hypothetical protein